MTKIIRTICVFGHSAGEKEISLLEQASEALTRAGFTVQTKRICLSQYHSGPDDPALSAKGVLLGLGSVSPTDYPGIEKDFLASSNKFINLDLTSEEIGTTHADILFRIIAARPESTFRFTYGFNLPPGSPYFPSAKFSQPGFSVGLQPTDLSGNCATLPEWLDRMRAAWAEIDRICENIPGYLGIDSSVAPLYEGVGSLVNFISRLGYDFSHSVTTDIYTQITKFIREQNPRPVGLCGLMFPCLEDFELAAEYEKGNFPVERNIFLSLHSGLGIDVYPIGTDEQPERLVEILRLLQTLSGKYQKPLSARFISDGQAKIDDRTDFHNPYLKDVVIRKL
ncbi:MAG: DUF711 family protein [Candidatus Liptonbacteria bacterium]|nr:DUF711 family protein [Candidatus Liptonbacteria bacterium]